MLLCYWWNMIKIKGVIFDYGGVVLRGIDPVGDFYLYPEMIDFIIELKEKGFKTAVLSNTIESHKIAIESRNGYKDFDAVVLSCDCGLEKPDPKIYKLTAEKLGVKPEECIFIDDIKENLMPARKLGMKTILARNPKQIIKDVNEIIN